MHQRDHALRQSIALRALRVTAVGVFLVAGALPAEAQNAALVTDLLGHAKEVGDGHEAKLTILSEIVRGAIVEVERGARCTVLYPASGNEYIFTGPTKVRFGAEEPQVVDGPAPQRRTSLLSKELRYSLKPESVVQAAYVMRGVLPAQRIKLITLNRTKTLGTMPKFRWQGPESGLKYHLDLTDDMGRSLYSSDLEATSLTLPPTVTLKEGVTYMWEVSARTADGRRYASTGDFSIAPASLRKRVEELRPSASAPAAERVLFAAWLDQQGLRDEARKYWQILSVERPEDHRLRGLAKR